MTTQTSLINTDPFAQVKLDRLFMNEKPTDKYAVAMQLPGSSEFTDIPGVSPVHGENYKLVTNKAVHDVAMAVIDASGMTFEPVPGYGSKNDKAIFWDGKRFAERWYTKDVQTTSPNGRSMFALGMQATNSYGGSSAVSFSFFGMHLLCNNQFHSRNLMGTPYSFTHINRDGGDPWDDFSEAKVSLIEKANSFSAVGSKLQLLKDTRVDGMPGFLDTRRKMHESGISTHDRAWLNELSGDGITKELGLSQDNYNDPESYFALASAFTALTTHLVGGVSGAKQSGAVLDWLLSAARAQVA